MATIAKWRAGLISIALIAIVASPVIRRPVDDGFPLSTYPMFAFPRPTQLTLDYAVGETAAGAREPLTPMLVGSREVLQARAVLERAVHAGARELRATCERIAANIAADGGDAFADVVAVHIVTGTNDAVDYLVRHVRGTEIERIRCAVTR